MWSRVGSFSITVVSPLAASPASRTALLTWAEGTGSSYSIGTRSLVPRMVSGSVSLFSRTSSPICFSGRKTRPMGRRDKDGSPISRTVIGCPAMTPIMSRAPVPELPKSSGSEGWLRPPTPRPRISQTSPDLRAGAPRAVTAFAVLSTSSDSSRLLTRVRPVARAPKMSARWEIDLSPGTRQAPRSGAAEEAVSGRERGAVI